MDIREGNSVRITHLNDLPKKILSHDLGMRQEGAVGIVVTAAVPGLDSEAIRVEHRDPFGEKNGGWGIYFLGEFEQTYDLLP